MRTITNNELSMLSNKEKCGAMKMIIDGQAKYIQPIPSNPYPQCATCRYLPLNITQGPCMTCENGSEYVRSRLSKAEGQEID